MDNPIERLRNLSENNSKGLKSYKEAKEDYASKASAPGFKQTPYNSNIEGKSNLSEYEVEGVFELKFKENDVLTSIRRFSMCNNESMLLITEGMKAVVVSIEREPYTKFPISYKLDVFKDEVKSTRVLDILDTEEFFKMENNPIENLRKLQRSTSMSYNDILIKWNNSSITGGIFKDHLLISLTSEVNKIEGIDMSYNNTKEVLTNGSVSNFSGDIRDLYSVLNNQRLADYLNESLDNKVSITSKFIRDCHRILMYGAVDNHSFNNNKERAGEYKKSDYCVGRLNVGVEPKKVERYIEDLCVVINTVKPNTDILKVASIFHCYFEAIHPFADGNGRLGRWLLNYLLVLNNHPPVNIPSSYKDKYYSCLEKYDEFEDFESMYKFLKDMTELSYGSYSYLLI